MDTRAGAGYAASWTTEGTSGVTTVTEAEWQVGDIRSQIALRRQGRWRNYRCWFLITAIIAGLFACCGGMSYFAVRPKNGIWVERLKADLNERLPDGSTRDQAEQWFLSHGIKPYLITDMSNRWDELGATIPNSGLLENAEIRIYLYFSPDGLLQERIIYRFVASP